MLPPLFALLRNCTAKIIDLILMEHQHLTHLYAKRRVNYAILYKKRSTHQAACSTHLAACRTNQAACSTHLSACRTNQAACSTHLAACRTNQAACRTHGTQCTPWRTHQAACSTHLAVCRTNQSACSTHQAACSTHHMGHRARHTGHRAHQAACSAHQAARRAWEPRVKMNKYSQWGGGKKLTMGQWERLQEGRGGPFRASGPRAVLPLRARGCGVCGACL